MTMGRPRRIAWAAIEASAAAPLALVGVEDDGAVLRADVRALPVQRRWDRGPSRIGRGFPRRRSSRDRRRRGRPRRGRSRPSRPPRSSAIPVCRPRSRSSRPRRRGGARRPPRGTRSSRRRGGRSIVRSWLPSCEDTAGEAGEQFELQEDAVHRSPGPEGRPCARGCGT